MERQPPSLVSLNTSQRTTSCQSQRFLEMMMNILDLVGGVFTTSPFCSYVSQKQNLTKVNMMAKVIEVVWWRLRGHQSLSEPPIPTNRPDRFICRHDRFSAFQNFKTTKLKETDRRGWTQATIHDMMIRII